MPIDRSEAMAILAKHAHAEREHLDLWFGAKQNGEGYKLLSQSEAWQALRSWLEARLQWHKGKEEEAVLSCKLTHDLTHGNLLMKKALLDISQAEVLIISQLLDKVRQFATEEHHDDEERR